MYVCMDVCICICVCVLYVCVRTETRWYRCRLADALLFVSDVMRVRVCACALLRLFVSACVRVVLLCFGHDEINFSVIPDLTPCTRIICLYFLNPNQRNGLTCTVVCTYLTRVCVQSWASSSELRVTCRFTDLIVLTSFRCI
jgi:hypothetical protein